MNCLCGLLRRCGAWFGSVCNQRLKAIGERGSEVFDFAVKETIEAFPLVRGVVVESSESCSQVLKVLDCPSRVAGRGCSDDGRLTWWNGIIGSFPFIPELRILAVRVRRYFFGGSSRCFGLTPGSKGRSRLCLCLF